MVNRPTATVHVVAVAAVAVADVAYDVVAAAGFA